TVTAPSPNFTISASPGSLSLVQGTSGSSTISTTVVGSGGTISLSVSGTRSEANTSELQSPSTAVYSAPLDVSTGSAAAGTYTLTLTRTERPVPYTTLFRSTVTAPSPNFTISASPGSLSLVQGTSGSSTISTTVVGSGGTISLSVSGT